jgi:NitT/TauT family transport system ATP-binding protein
MLTLSGVGKTYPGGTVALAGVDLAIPDGSFTSIVGPSGCGKSTILRMIAGLTAPTEGTISGRQAGSVGLVFQDATLMPWATVEKNVTLPLRLAGITPAEARPRVIEGLGLVGLAEFAQEFPHALSGGMRMRVAIARSLVTAPNLLLMDEPFAALDEITRSKLNDDLLLLWRDRGFTAVFVTHSVFESVYLSTDIAIMTGRPGRIFARHAVDRALPRDAAFRTSRTYAETCAAVSRDLEGAMREAA